jgi:hypothetical protein
MARKRKCGDPRDAFNPMRIAAERAVLCEAERRGVADGVRVERSRCEREHRIETFAAIRRAAAVARRAEKWSGVSAYEGFVMAQGVRAAIRAAVGSDKT